MGKYEPSESWKGLKGGERKKEEVGQKTRWGVSEDQHQWIGSKVNARQLAPEPFSTLEEKKRGTRRFMDRDRKGPFETKKERESRKVAS